MFSSFFRSRQWALWAYGGGLLIVVLIWCEVETLVLLNWWQSYFWDLLQKSDQYAHKSAEGIRLMYDYLFSFAFYFNGFTGKPSFATIILPYIILHGLINWISRLYALRWREAMTFCYIPEWKNVEKDIEGASQRIQEDCKSFATIIDSLGVSFVRAIITLIAFLPILWRMSEKIPLLFIGVVQGSLVWCIILLSLGGLVISWFVGAKLPGLEYKNQRVEAAFRKDLVLAEDDKKNYAKLDVIKSLFKDIRFNYHHLFRHYTYFDMWTRIYSRFMFIFPFMIMGPGLFAGAISLGTLLRVKNAFQEVDENFSLLLYNWVKITELRSIRKRLVEFERNLLHSS